MPKGGLILEPLKPRDYLHEKIYGAAPRTTPLIPFDRDVTGIPVVCQGEKPYCVAATITWIKQWQEIEHPDLSHEHLALIAKIGDNGASPSQVLEPARKQGILPQTIWQRFLAETHQDGGFSSEFETEAEKHKIKYARVKDLSMRGIYAALKETPLAIGVRNWKGVGPHFMAAVGVTKDGLALKCVNWWSPNSTMIEEVPFKAVVVAYSFPDPKLITNPDSVRAGFMASFGSFIGFYKQFVAVGTAILGVLGGVLGLDAPKQDYSSYLAPDGSRWEVNFDTGDINPPKDQKEGGDIHYGASYTPVTGYESSLTSRVAAADTAVPVASTRDQAGNQITTANISPSSTVRIYLTVEPGGTREEIIYCTGVTATQFTPCTRGLNFQGGSIAASTTLAQIHPAGSKIIMSNVGVFFTEFVSVDGYQQINDMKDFLVLPRVVATGTLPTFSSQLATKLYVDNVGAGGFTASNASTTQGIIVNGTSPETIGVNLLDTLRNSCHTYGGGLFFDPANSCALSLNSSSTQFTITSDGLLTLNLSGITFNSLASSTVAGGSPINMNALTAFSATGTAGESITAGNALYISTTGTLFLTSASQTTTTYRYVGVAQSGANVGQTVLYTRPGGIATISGLSAGEKYLLGNTAGSVSRTAGSVPATIGRALSSTSIQLEKPSFYAVSTTNQNVGTIKTYQLGWIPSTFTAYGGSSPAGGPLTNASVTSSWMVNADATASSTVGCNQQTYTTTSNGIIFNACGVGVNAGMFIKMEYLLDGVFLN